VLVTSNTYKGVTCLTVTSVGQTLLQNLEQNMSAFKLFVGENIQRIELQQIENINEILMSFDMISNFTIDKKYIENIKNTKEKLYLRVISQN